MTHKLKTADEISRSRRTDIYFGVVAPVGIRRESFQAALERTMKRFDYATEMVRLSKLLSDFKQTRVDEGSETDRLRTAMDAGSKLREAIGADVLTRQAMNVVNGHRSASKERPTAYVFWSLKHPEEVATLRRVYGPSFHLVGLFASEEDRIRELTQRPGIDKEAARGHVTRDREEEGRGQGQRTRDTFHRADVFLRWSERPDEGALARFVDILFGRPDVTPTADEHRMFLAFAGALRSGELSRQVGATLVSDDGDLMAVGANDVPRRGGGLYWPVPGDDDRDARRGEDSNVQKRRELLGKVGKAVAEEFQLSSPEEVARVLEKSDLKQITEYGRAVHAEMEALLACARSGRSTRRATLYVTTYPCHNCARHIIAAGVERVVFVEPYPKSLALDLHDRDVMEVPPGKDAAGGDGRVRFEPYLGVGPRRFFDYFSMGLGGGYELQRKDQQGHLAYWDPATAAPRGQLPSLPVAELEKSLTYDVLEHLNETEEHDEHEA